MKRLIMVASLLLAAPLSLHAQGAPTPPVQRGGMATFAEFDLNGDGSVTADEFTEARNRRIAARAAEGRPMRGLAQAEEFATIDTDADGKLSPEEFTAHQQRHWQNRPR